MTTDTFVALKEQYSFCVTYIKKPGKYGTKIGVCQVALGIRGKESTCQCRRQKTCGFGPWVRKIPWRRKWQSTPVFLPGESHGQRSLMGYSPWGHKSWTWLKWLTMHTHISFFNKSSSCSLIFSYLCKLFVKRLKGSTGHKVVNGDDDFSWHTRS